ncbi:hypothetical protein K437DRAFT_257000 [Tilletiaria anomala UBC 951]|uniref:Tetratricopeptide SHNi-TPR domain-containing protein n=1 Tax=Tilletiaria anomala (strain ATCC 24038 / CBS 436.72 / UBC 951) TaxID=1037660 RepID=A0A066W192_TILAU|nr:uncharacterized protein K437DRAFT_257000 [Tilletiaria anomala UBC 951]KDN44565.1 hypothetical protein K437DRAFT_257000 [Tilletiaria anomala UBC 951]
MSSEDAATAAAPQAPAPGGAQHKANGGIETPPTLSSSSTRRLYDEAKRELALKQYSPAADKLARVLEALQDREGEGEEKHAQDAPILAPILHRYGKAMLGLAVANSGALGSGGTDPTGGAAAQATPLAAGESPSSTSTSKANDPRFSFGGDAEEEMEEVEDDGQEQQAEDDDEDEDDFGLAFTVLDLARVIYEKRLDADGASPSLTTYEGEQIPALQIKAQLAEVYNDLGDVGLETENFQQASTDYEQSLNILSPLLRAHSRRLADAQLRLGLALEFHPDLAQRPRALQYVTAASTTLKGRLNALKEREQVLSKGEGIAATNGAAPAAVESKSNGKGKGKEDNDEGKLLEKDDVADMDAAQVALETKDVQEMIEELSVKLEEYEQHSAAAGDASSSAAASAIGLPGGLNRAALEKAINDAFLGASTNTGAFSGFPGASADLAGKPVNDLSGMVKKKRPIPGAEDGNGKRKLEDTVVANATSTATEPAAEANSDAKRVKTD